MVKILVDVEEQRSPVPSCLAELGVEVELRQLRVGDYLVARGVAVERKTVVDLRRSLASGRIWSQLHALVGGTKNSYLLVEGVSLDGSGLTPRGVRGALLQVGECGVSVVRSANPRESALWLDLIARRRQRQPTLSSRHGRRRMVVSPIGLLATVPGISPMTARRLLDRFGTVAGIASASQSELREVRGIGAARAASLHRLLR